MYYNLIEFGKRLSEIRSSLNLSINDVSEIALVNPSTIRRIESGKVIPKQETLDFLSTLYKKDLNSFLLNYRIDDLDVLVELRNRIELKLDSNDIFNLDGELEELKSLFDLNMSSCYKNYIDQLILLLEALTTHKKENKFDEAIDKLIQALKLTSPNFSMGNYSSFIYSPIEMRILMNISVFLKKKNPLKSIEIMEFLLYDLNQNDILYPKLCYNLSNTYHKLDNHHSALKYSDLGVEYCLKNRNQNGLNLLYFRKGVAEFLLGKDHYISSLNKAVHLSDILGHNDLKELMIKNLYRIYNIKIDSI